MAQNLFMHDHDVGSFSAHVSLNLIILKSEWQPRPVCWFHWINLIDWFVFLSVVSWYKKIMDKVNTSQHILHFYQRRRNTKIYKASEYIGVTSMRKDTMCIMFKSSWYAIVIETYQPFINKQSPRRPFYRPAPCCASCSLTVYVCMQVCVCFSMYMWLYTVC